MTSPDLGSKMGSHAQGYVSLQRWPLREMVYSYGVTRTVLATRWPSLSKQGDHAFR